MKWNQNDMVVFPTVFAFSIFFNYFLVGISIFLVNIIPTKFFVGISHFYPCKFCCLRKFNGVVKSIYMLYYPLFSSYEAYNNINYNY